jgi:hypothetical protein
VEVRPLAGLPAFRAWLRDSIAYVATGSVDFHRAFGEYTEAASVAMVDVDDLDHPRALGYIWTPELATDLAVADDYAFILGQNPIGGGNWERLWFIAADLSDPTQPKIAQSLELDGLAGSLAYRGGYAYVAGGPSGVYVVSAAAGVLVYTLTLDNLYAR